MRTRSRSLGLMLLLVLSLLLGALAPASAQKRTLLQEDVGMVNALNYGNTFDQVAVNAAISAIGSTKRVLLLAVGTWALHTNVTVPVNITLYIPAGVIVAVDAGVTLTLATIPQYDQPYWFTGAGTLLVTDRTWPIDVRVYGAFGDGVNDDTPAVQKAITAATTGDGGTVLFPCGTYVLYSQITVLNKQNLTLRGPTAARGFSTTNQCATLELRADAGAMFHFDGQTGLEIGWLNLTYTQAAYVAGGLFLRLDRSASLSFTTQVYIHDGTMQGGSLSSKEGHLIFLDGTTDVTIERMTFSNARVAIHGPSVSAANTTNIRIRDNRFEPTFVDAPIKPAGIGWVIEGNRFQGLSNGGQAALTILPPGVYGLAFQGNTAQAAGLPAGGAWISTVSGPILGGLIAGNLFQDGGSSGWCIFLYTNSVGVTITGNYLNCGISYAGGIDTLFAGNYSGSPTAVGAQPTGNSLSQLPSFGVGAFTSGAGRWRLGASGAAGGKRVLCYDPTTDVGRLYVSSTGTDCSN